MKKFPTYSRAEDAVCFNCGKQLDDVKDVGYPDGNGRYRGTCPKCGYHTYFDIREVKDAT